MGKSDNVPVSRVADVSGLPTARPELDDERVDLLWSVEVPVWPNQDSS